MTTPGSSIVLMSPLAAHRNAGRNSAYESSKAAQLALACAVAVAGEPMDGGALHRRVQRLLSILHDGITDRLSERTGST